MNNLLIKIKKHGWLLVAGGLLLAGLCGNVCVQAQDTTAGKTVQEKKFQRLIKKKNTVLLDVRTTEEYKAGHIPGSVQIDVLNREDFKKKLAALDTKKTYLLYCRSGKRSKDAMTLMNASGFAKLYDLKGGFSNWKGAKEQQP